MVYKRCCAYHFELLSTTGFQAYYVTIMPVVLLGQLRVWILSRLWVSSRIQAVLAHLEEKGPLVPVGVTNRY